MLVNMEKLIKNAERNLKDFTNNISKDMQHITDKYTDLNEGLSAIGFYTQDMDKESIQSSLVEFIKKEQTDHYSKKLGEIFNG